MQSIFKIIVLFTAFSFATGASAVPTLQLGVSDGAGGYIAYTPAGTSPTEEETAYTSGNAIVVGGAYGPNADLLIGGKYGSGADWSAFGFDASFDGKGAVLMATVSNALSDLTIDGLSAFFTSTTNLFPNEHAPLGSAASFLFFDIGDFAKIANAVSDFACSNECTATGELKTLTLGGTGAYDWIHFDVMALVTDTYGETDLKTGVGNNPGSHDVTWKNSATNVPEPSTVLLFGLGMMGLLMVRKAQGSSSH